LGLVIGPSLPSADVVDDDAEVRDELPADLDASGYVGPYLFPNNNRRRIPGYLYIAIGVMAAIAWLVAPDDAVWMNEGVLFGGLLLIAVGSFHLLSGYDLAFDEQDALVAAGREVGFPVGHASAQLGWRGVRSRPTWRILLYSDEPTPLKRGLVLVDGVNGDVIEHFVEENPEDWSDL
jgi:hypothetical protein